MNQKKIIKLLQTNTQTYTPKTSHRIDQLIAKYKGKPLPYDGYKGSDCHFVSRRAKTLKSPHRLMAMAQINSSDVARNLLENKNLTADIIEYLYFQTTYKGYLIGSILYHQATPVTVLKDILKQHNQAESHYINIITHENTTEEMLDPLIQKETNFKIIKQIIKKLETTERLKKIYQRFSTNDHVLYELCYNPNTPVEILKAMTNANTTPPLEIIEHCNITPELLELLYQRLKDKRSAKYKFSCNPKTPEHIMKGLSLSEDYHIVSQATENSTFELRVKMKHTARNATEVLFVSDSKVDELLGNDGTPIEMLRAIYHKVKGNDKKLIELIKHPNIDADLTEEMIKNNRWLACEINSKFEFYFDENETGD